MQSEPILDEVLLEFTRVGNAVKVCAVDPKTGTEVVIQGPVTVGEETLRRTAIGKLRYVMRRDRSKASFR